MYLNIIQPSHYFSCKIQVILSGCSGRLKQEIKAITSISLKLGLIIHRDHPW